jgi:hypothetical protein
MEPYTAPNGSTRFGTGRDRNDMRVKSLLEWWSSRGGKVR